jgi:hypothetical protein
MDTKLDCEVDVEGAVDIWIVKKRSRRLACALIQHWPVGIPMSLVWYARRSFPSTVYEYDYYYDIPRLTR